MSNQLSVYEHEKRARAQGFAFVVNAIGSQWGQYGYVMWSTEAAANESAAHTKAMKVEVVKIKI